MGLLEEVEKHRSDIQTDSYTVTWRELLNQYRDGDLLVNPDYQRLFRWDVDQQTQYIESLLLGIPTPPVFLAQNEDGKLEVLDGLQRISTLLKFFANERTPKPAETPSQDELDTDVEQNDISLPTTLLAGRFLPSLDGANSTNLPETLIRAVKYARINVIIIEKGSKRRARYEVFRRRTYTEAHTRTLGTMYVSEDRAALAVQLLIEGNSIRSTERITKLDRNTIMRVLVLAGERCQSLMNAKMRNLHSRYLQIDEIWTYVQKKARRVRKDDSPEVGDQWVFVAIDAETKLIPAFHIGKRHREDTRTFLWDLYNRIEGRTQITTDGLFHYTAGVPDAFGLDVDFAQLVKLFGEWGQHDADARYSPSPIVEVISKVRTGDPDPAHISTMRLLFSSICGVFLVSMLACGSGSKMQPVATHVYSAGFQTNDAGAEIATYWNDGKAAVLGAGTNPSYATSIAVSGTNVYVAGVEGNGTNDVAKYWKNGIPVDLTDGTQRGFANSVVVSGTDVYVAGGEQTGSSVVAKYWKNGVPLVLPDLGQGALAQSVFVLGTDVYVAGWQNKTTQLDPTHTLHTQVATYWKNGVPTELTNGTALSIAYSIFVTKTDVYVAGFACQNLAPNCGIATYWKNGVQVQLTNITDTTASSVFVSGTNVYASGNQNNDIAQLWKDGAPAQLSGASSGSAANQVFVSGPDVFVAGASLNNSGVPLATYWKNGEPVQVGDGTHVSSAFALTVVIR